MPRAKKSTKKVVKKTSGKKAVKKVSTKKVVKKAPAKRKVIRRIPVKVVPVPPAPRRRRPRLSAMSPSSLLPCERPRIDTRHRYHDTSKPGAVHDHRVGRPGCPSHGEKPFTSRFSDWVLVPEIGELVSPYDALWNCRSK